MLNFFTAVAETTARADNYRYIKTCDNNRQRFDVIMQVSLYIRIILVR